MAIKKSELYSSLWKSCDELRGGMDASQYKKYVLVLLFVKYVSDKYANAEDALIEIPQGGSFQDIVNLKGKKDIGEKINLIIKNLAEANDLGNIFNDADFNDEDKLGKGQEMKERLTNLVAIFENPALNFSKNRADGDDILGDAYEYLMRNFATQSGKSKGQFYTPAEVSRVIAKVIGINSVTSPQQSIYDPTCGSGSLLLKAADETDIKISIFGQEMDNATYSLAQMNMILHGHPTREIWQDNTLSNPHFKNSDGSLKTFDFAVANPPFSAKAWSTGIDLEKDEFEPTQELHNQVLRKYGELTEEEVKTLVVDDKWMRTLKQGINAEMDRISQRLTQRIKELGERYDTPLFELSDEVDRLTSLVDQHLQNMGFVW